MQTNRRVLYKGLLIFALFNFIGYLLFAAVAFVMSWIGLSCRCFDYTAAIIAGVALVAFVACWYTTCRGEFHANSQ